MSTEDIQVVMTEVWEIGLCVLPFLGVCTKPEFIKSFQGALVSFTSSFRSSVTSEFLVQFAGSNSLTPIAVLLTGM